MTVDESTALPDRTGIRRRSAARLSLEGGAGGRIGRYIAVMAGLLIASLSITLGLLFWSARTQDDIAIASSRDFAGTAMEIQLGQLKKLLIDYTFWDDAYLNLVETLDHGWYDVNFADVPYLPDTFGVTSTFLVGPDNRVLRHMHRSVIDEDARSLNIDAHVEGGLSRLIEQARNSVDGAFPAAGGLVRVAGELNFAAARVIHPHTKELLARVTVVPDSAHVAVMMRPIDDELLEALASDFALADLKFVPQLADSELLNLPLKAIDGQSFGYLTWKIDRPSGQVYAVILPALSAVILFIGLLGFYVLRLVRNNQTTLFHAMLKAQAADRAKVQFLSNVSHELRTPLNGVIGLAQILGHGELQDEQKKLLDTLLSSAHHQLALIGDLLDVTRIESDHLKLDCRPFDLCSTITESVALVDHKAKSKGLAVHLSLPDNPPEQVMGDPVRFRQICLILLDNAIKFTDSGHVAISLSAQTAGAFENVELTVQDTGVGIEKESQPRVFSRFMQVDTSTARSAEGLGLGLPICQALVTAMGGRIALQSIPGEGTRFVVFVKLRREGAPEQEAQEPGAEAPKHRMQARS